MSNARKKFTKKEEPIRNNSDFWKWFEANQKDFHQAVKVRDHIERDFFERLSPKLAKLKDGYFFLAGMLNETTAELILTADGNPKNISFVEDLVAEAPDMEGWKITGLKPPADIKDFCIQLGGYKFDEENLSFYPDDSPDFPDEINLTIAHREWNEKDQKEITVGVYVFLDNYLGEIDAITKIDSVNVIRRSDAEKELIPIGKLKDFLNWREKEFVEKYEGSRHDTENDEHSILEGDSESGNRYLAVVNNFLLNWDRKASHPWIAALTIRYDGRKTNGMPSRGDNEKLAQIENYLLEELKAKDGYLHFGRRTADGERENYFACKDFRKPSKVFFEIEKKFGKLFSVEYDIYRDKYWQSFEHFRTY